MKHSDYQFSVVMAVYNVEKYIAEAVGSVIDQTIGFQRNIQIIFVDDGSTDNCGIICDRYKEKYPDNIVVIHKKNEGQAKARLEGLKYARGKYINFFDPDDILSLNAMEKVLEFYKTYRDEVDVVAIPIFFFGYRKGAHPLNDKFEKGTRVIDLLQEWKTGQMSLASSFVRREALDCFSADAEIVTAEDAIELIKILVRKSKLGVVKDAQYKYRKRRDSTVGQAQSRKGWYNTYLTHFSEWACNYCKKTKGYVPKFVQYTVLYDLQWKYSSVGIPAGILTKEEEKQYRNHLFSLARYFDDDVILSQKSINGEHKLYLLKEKYGKDPVLVRNSETKETELCYNGATVYKLSDLLVTVRRIDILRDKIFVEYTQMIPNIALPAPRFYIDVSGSLIPAEVEPYDNTIYSVGISIGKLVACKAFLPLPQKGQQYCISFITGYDDVRIKQSKTDYGKYAPLTLKVKGAHYYKNGIMLETNDKGFVVRRVSEYEASLKELKHSFSLLLNNDIAAKKAAFARLAALCGRLKKKKQIWLVCDKADRADDNGEAFFTYLQEIKPENVDAYFLIGKDSPDFERIRKIGKVVPYMSKEHKSLYLKADYVISAYSHDEINNPFFKNAKYYADLLHHCQYVFLQHGITKDDVSAGLNRFHKNIKLLICSARAEADSFLHNVKYGYSEKEIGLTGFPRYDRLYHAEKDEIVIMPSWRRGLFGSYQAEKSQWHLMPGFEESAFYQFYNSLLNDGKLLRAARETGHKINFVPHPVFFPYIDRFSVPEEVSLWGTEVTYRDMFARNRLLLTDFSSVAFDFAYLRKPVIYAHFDTNHYAEGYFDYERDGFGEVEYNLESTIARIIEYMDNGCQLKDKYRRRIDRFFTFNDQNNCQRVYEAIKELQ